MIDLTNTRNTLDAALALIDELDQLDLDDRGYVETTGKDAQRVRRAQVTHQLIVLGNHLELAAALVRNEYGFVRGHDDPLDPDRSL